MILIPYNQAPVILKPGKKSFNIPSASVGSQLSAILSFGLFTTHSMWRNHLYTAFLHQFLIKRITVISLITDELVWRIRSKTAVDCFLNKLHFMRGGAFHTSGDRKTRSVCDCHALGAFATLRLADSKTPFFAGAKLPSMNASLISIFLRSYRSLASSYKISWKVPRSVHSWKRRWQVWYGGYLEGISFQGAPVRNIHNIPFITSLAGLGFRPRGSFAGVVFNIMGSIRVHCSFVSSILIILHNQDVKSRFISNNFKRLRMTKKLSFISVDYDPSQLFYC